jgi:Amt family ammonium transporter
MTTLATVFKDQVTVDQFSQNIFYWIAAGAVTLAIVGLCFIDIGLVQRRNILDTVLQKLMGFLIGTLSFAFVGLGIWNWQFYNAFGTKNPYGQSISDWWLGGDFVRHFAQSIDPAVAPGANNTQIFLVFLAVYGGFVCVLLHFAGSERMKAGPYYIMSAVIGGIVYPLLLWLTWGSTSPLTNNGTHDFVGVFTAYIFVGTFGYVLAKRLGPRAGLFKPHPKNGPWVPYNLGLSGIGVIIVLFAIPLIVLGCGYFVPGQGYFGIAMTTSGFGIVLLNVFMGFCGGAVTGGILSYRTKNPVHALLGPISGYLAGVSGFDVIEPWQMLLIALAAPLVVAVVYNRLHDRGIDESKVVPLGASALFGTVVISFVAWGTKTGGFLGIKSGPFAFQHAEITPWWQLIGIGVTVGFALVSAFVLVFGLDKLMGLRVSEEVETEGLDPALWNIPPVGAELQAPALVPDAGQPVSPAPVAV